MTALYKGSIAFDNEFSIIDLTLEQLVESDFHLGSKLSRFDKLNFSYIFSRRFDVIILNLSYSLYNLRLAVYFLSVIVSRRGKILFFDSHESTRNFVHFIGTTSRQYYINRKWIAGLLTNFKNFYPAVFTGISRHFRFSESKYAGMRYIHRPPNVSCLLNIERGSSAFIENFRLAIPTIALINSDNSISGVTFPIFSNNSSIYTYFSFFAILRSAILNGYKDEIYKFYRKSLKKILKFRYKKFASHTRLKNSIYIFMRFYFVKLLFSYKIIFYKFFLFLLYNLKSNNFLSKIIFLFIRDLSYFQDRLLIDSKNYSIHDLTRCKFAFSEIFSISDLNSRFFDNFLRSIAKIFFSDNFFNYFLNFRNHIYPVFMLIFNLFISTSYKQFRPSVFSKFSLDFKLAFFLLNKWEKYYSGNKFVVEFSRHFPHEFFPFFEYSRRRPDYRVSRFSRLLTFKARNSGLFHGGVSNLSLNAINMLYRDFKKALPYKSMTFSKKFKRIFRIFFKRMKFLKFLWKSLYPKKKASLFFDVKNSKYVILSKRFLLINKDKEFFKSRFFSGLTVKDSIRRENLRTLNNNIMLQYFDEEYDDYKFPINSEFFFLQVAYGAIFLGRQYERNKMLSARRTSSYTLVRKQRTLARLKLNVKLNRSTLYFFFISKFYKNNLYNV